MSDIQHIRDTYWVPARIGGRVRYQPPDGATQYGTIVSTLGPYLRVRYDGSPRTAIHHPTWCLSYLDDECQP